MELEGRTALVTGGARRVGRGICLALAERGVRVAVHYCSSETEAREVAARCGGSVTLRADLNSAAAGTALVRDAREALGGLDILVNNAAIYERTPPEELDEATWGRHLATNLTAPFFSALEAGRLMKEAGCGVIVNLTDWGVDRPHPAFLPYYTAKAGLAAATAGLARALAPQVRVNAVAPGAALLPPAQAEKIRRLTPLGRMGGVPSVVSTVMFLIGNDFVTGQTITVDGGRSLC